MKRMQDYPWRIPKEDVDKLYPELSPGERIEAAKTLTAYVHTVAKIYDRLNAEGEWEKVKLRLEYDKRYGNKQTLESQK